MTKMIYWGHHKCASTWMTKILHTVAHRAGWSIGKHETWKDSDHHHLRRLLTEKDTIISPNSRLQDSALAAPVPGYHIIRDPRDLLISAYFSHKNTHPTRGWDALPPQRAILRASGFDDGVISTMDFLDGTIASIADWDYKQPHVLELKMEDITKRPYQALLDIFDHVGALKDPIELDHLSNLLDRVKARIVGLDAYPARWLLQDVHSHRYKKLSGGRKPGEVSLQSHYRSGTPGDWKNHWSDKIQDAYTDRFGELHKELGYSGSW